MRTTPAHIVAHDAELFSGHPATTRALYGPGDLEAALCHALPQLRELYIDLSGTHVTAALSKATSLTRLEVLGAQSVHLD